MYNFEERRPEMEALCRRFGVTQLMAFGSSVREDFSEASDIDLVIKAPRSMDLLTFGSLREELEHLFGRKVDLLTQERLDEMTNPFRKRGILSHLMVLYAA